MESHSTSSDSAAVGPLLLKGGISLEETRGVKIAGFSGSNGTRVPSDSEQLEPRRRVRISRGCISKTAALENTANISLGEI